MSGPEKPRHIDARITDLGVDDLITAFGRPAGVTDLSGLRRHLRGRIGRPAWPILEWVDAARGSCAAEEMITRAEPLLGEIDVTGASLGRSQRYGFNYLGWLRPAVDAWLLTGDIGYLRAFERHFCAWYATRGSVPGEWPGLDVVWYSLGTWARCAELLPTVEVLTDAPIGDDCWAALIGTLIGGARWAYDEHDVFRHGNWQLVSATQLLQIGAVLPDLTEAPAWVERGRRRIEEHLRLDVYPDGGHYERSPGYHAMCLAALQLAAVIESRSLGGDLARHPRLAAMHRWLATLSSADGWVPHLQDSNIVRSGSFLLRGGYALDDPELVLTARRLLEPAEFALQVAALPGWPDPERERRWQQAVIAEPGPVADTGPATTVLPESGYVVIDSADRRVRTVINAGPHIEHELESHSHRAVLDLTVEACGRPVLWEAGGPPTYDDPDYLTWFQSGRGHNTVTVAGRELDPERQLDLDPVTATGLITRAAGNHHGNGFAQRRELIMVTDEPSVLLVRDDAEPGHPPCTAHWHAPSAWQPVPGSKPDALSWLAAESDRAGLQLIVATGAGSSEATEVEQSVGRARFPHRGAQPGAYAPLHSLHLTRESGRFDTFLIPRDRGSGGPARLTADGTTFELRHGGVRDLVDGAQWSRSVDGGLRWACAWQSNRLQAGDFMITSSRPATLQLRADGELVTLEVQATGRCTLTLTGLRAHTLAGVEIAVDDRVTIPHAGRWTVGCTVGASR